MGFCAAAQIVRIHRHFTQRPSGAESDETVLGITSCVPLSEPTANAKR